MTEVEMSEHNIAEMSEEDNDTNMEEEEEELPEGQQNDIDNPEETETKKRVLCSEKAGVLVRPSAVVSVFGTSNCPEPASVWIAAMIHKFYCDLVKKIKDISEEQRIKVTPDWLRQQLNKFMEEHTTKTMNTNVSRVFPVSSSSRNNKKATKTTPTTEATEGEETTETSSPNKVKITRKGGRVKKDILVKKPESPDGDSDSSGRSKSPNDHKKSSKFSPNNRSSSAKKLRNRRTANTMERNPFLASARDIWESESKNINCEHSAQIIEIIATSMLYFCESCKKQVNNLMENNNKAPLIQKVRFSKLLPSILLKGSLIRKTVKFSNKAHERYIDYEKTRKQKSLITSDDNSSGEEQDEELTTTSLDDIIQE